MRSFRQRLPPVNTQLLSRRPCAYSIRLATVHPMCIKIYILGMRTAGGLGLELVRQQHWHPSPRSGFFTAAYPTCPTRPVLASVPHSSSHICSYGFPTLPPQLFLQTRSQLPTPQPALQAPTVLSHDQDIPTLVLGWQEDLGDHDEDLALGRGVDVPDAFHAGWVVARVVGGLDVASELT